MTLEMETENIADGCFEMKLPLKMMRYKN